jgi:protein-S-isoprenylcysteine O-methyltransferase Ste14
MVMGPKSKDNLLIAVGLFGVVGFLYLYTVKLFGQHGKPLTSAFIETYIGRPGLIILNIVIFASFLALLPYRRLSTERAWKSKGAFIGFMIALFTEMFGLPLVIYIFSPFFNYPLLRHASRQVLGSFGMIAGSWLTLAGIVLVVVGWRKIHSAKDLVTGGIYRYIRHPQYVGLFLIMTGWLVHWPTLLTLILFPILIIVYYRLAVREENEMMEVFGSRYEIYMKQTPRFFPNFKKFRRKAA